jgi:hypothetical protein
MKALTNNEKQLYNSLLEYAYGNNPHITLAALRSHVHKGPYNLTQALSSLEAHNLLMTGLEDTTDGDKLTYTPLVGKGVAYGWPCDEFTWDEWLAFSLPIDTGEEHEQ